MRYTIRAAVLALTMAVAGPVWADPAEDAALAAAKAAHKAKDYPTAKRAFQPLADQGNAEARFYLGLMYDFGEGVPKNYGLAVNWFRLAAEQGLAEAQFSLGSMYAGGQGVP